MVSFNEESRFTNIPIQGAAQAILRKLEADPSLTNHKTLTPMQIADLLNFVVRSTYFHFDGSFHEQEEGAAMGSSVSMVGSTWTILSHKLWHPRLTRLRPEKTM